MNLNEFEILEKAIEEIERCKKAHELLYSVWLELGPYNETLSTDLKFKLNDFFNFDDSE